MAKKMSSSSKIGVAAICVVGLLAFLTFGLMWRRQKVVEQNTTEIYTAAMSGVVPARLAGPKVIEALRQQQITRGPVTAFKILYPIFCELGGRPWEVYIEVHRGRSVQYELLRGDGDLPHTFGCSDVAPRGLSTK